MSLTFGYVTIPKNKVHEIKEDLKAALGGVAGLSRILSRRGADNFDFFVERNGTVWIGENGSGGKEKKTDVNFFQKFTKYAPKGEDLESNHPEGWDPFAIPDDSSDSDNDD